MPSWCKINFGLFKMDAPLFTIIIPTYNSGHFIAGCLDSIVNQSFKEVEILVKDGLSTDNTRAIVQEYSARYPAIKWVSEKDRGIYDAMNKSIFLSAGKWLYFLGSDDKLFDNKVLENISVTVLSDKNLQVIYGDVFSERFNGVYGGEYDNKKLLDQNICHQAIFFRKDIFELTGIFNLKYTAQADWDHNLKWFLNKEIRRKYLPVTIAWYADGGFSSLQGDKVFYRDLRLNYLKYGHSSLSFWTKLTMLQYEFLKSIKRSDLKQLQSVLRQLPLLVR
jgi:glycosyltransferase involved in cell wall biosynthesis